MGMLIAELRASQTDFVHTVSSIEGFQVHAFFNKLLVQYNTFLRVMRSLLNKFQYTNE
jgi:hypothetical protein